MVRSFFNQFSKGNVEAVLDLMAKSATYWIAGKPEKFALAGTKTREQIPEFFAWIATIMPGGLQVVPTGITAEGDRVAVEAESEGKTTTGKTYNNQYHFLFEVHDGKIQAIREYPDTMHAQEVLLDD